MSAQTVPASTAGEAKPFPLPASNSAVWPLLAIGLLLIMQLSMVFTRAVNWDEFWFYYHVADFARGTLAQPLQSLHVRLFAWLPGLPGSGVEKIQVARVVMLACEAATLFAIYALARRFVQRPAAVLAALLYLSAGYVLQHGFSFRTDPMATAALMSALAILGRARLNVLSLAAFALLIAVAGMITIKTALYAPAFLGLAWMRWAEDDFAPGTAIRLIAAALATVALFMAIYVWHASALTQATQGTDMAASASRWMFFLGVPEYWEMGVKAVLTAPILFLLAFLTPLAVWRSDLPTPAKLALTALWLPLTLPLFYTNSAAYFYVFMLAPVAVSVGITAQILLDRYPLALVTGVLAMLAAGAFLLEDRETVERQQALVEAAERLLPEGTAYFDHNGMLPSFVKANNLMTPAGINDYLLRARPYYHEEMERTVVPLLVANDELIETMLQGGDSYFLPEDTAALRDTYINAWGPLWLAGFAFESNAPITREVRVPGQYQVEGSPLQIDGKIWQPDDTVQLDRGMHTFTAVGNSGRLIWKTEAPLPLGAWDDGQLYVGF